MATKVLLVDDEPDITLVLGKGLSRYGFDVTTYNDPADALKAYKAGAYDLILLDIRMPNMTGLELASNIWNLDSAARICFLTSFELYEKEAAEIFPPTKQRCFLGKPISTEKLAKHIHTQLGIPYCDIPSII